MAMTVRFSFSSLVEDFMMMVKEKKYRLMWSSAGRRPHPHPWTGNVGSETEILAVCGCSKLQTDLFGGDPTNIPDNWTPEDEKTIYCGLESSEIVDLPLSSACLGGIMPADLSGFPQPSRWQVWPPLGEYCCVGISLFLNIGDWHFVVNLQHN